MNPHDPDPLVVLEDRTLEERYPIQTFHADAWLAVPHRHHERFIVAILVALAFGLGLFVGVRFAAATSRPAPEHVVPASVQGPIGAPPPATKARASSQLVIRQTAIAVLVSGRPRISGTGPDGAETAAASPTPSPVTVFEDTSPGITGTASFVSASYGPRYLALPGGPGIRVTICGRGGCVTRTSTDAGPSLFRQRQGRIADLSHADFFAVCGCPSWAGLTQVTVTPAVPRPTPPATDR